ncbi:glycosyltransferase family 2 protein [Spirosoma utsteinense]|uniref:GT2 family glycosyltransferase n=1 Tax=Spirosoma utsteinense TaxID=2585773 RepID=A0ABR6W7W9_9BACT|nr:glycosyltransferase family 2 protein [Spirosoma utsteinense]MBC3787714.1 GT2 family glycosyltransferase [Spirosoma utsteinense]MBC3792682.1 GT2 family glycosyltransferase [Spirosoma utsteinense]
METVAAVVVTYNRIADLQKCIESLRQQSRALDAIIVIDNGSTDGTDTWLAEQTGLSIVRQANLGGAGGFATGIDEAYKRSYDWLWCMDDDCLAAPDALEKLMNAPNIGPCIKNSVSVSNQDHSELAFYVDRPNRSYRKVADMTQFDLVYGVAFFFNGTLISSEVVKAIGLPDKKLFIWGDEVEYMTRAQKMGFPVVTVPSSIFYHPPSFDRNGIPWPGAWKQYYAVRNQRRVFQNIHGNKYGLVVFMSWSLRETMAQAVAKRANRMYNFLIYSEAAIDSVFNNFRKKPNHILTVRLYRLLNK